MICCKVYLEIYRKKNTNKAWVMKEQKEFPDHTVYPCSTLTRLNPHGASCSAVLQLFSFRVFYFQWDHWEDIWKAIYILCIPPILVDGTVFCCICYSCVSKHCEWQPSCFPSWMTFSYPQPLVCSRRQRPHSVVTAKDYMPQMEAAKVAWSPFFFFLQEKWTCSCLRL